MTLYLTLLAIRILQEGYPSERDQWQMIVSKAKDYLANQRINPDNLLRRFNIRVLG